MREEEGDEEVMREEEEEGRKQKGEKWRSSPTNHCQAKSGAWKDTCCNLSPVLLRLESHDDRVLCAGDKLE